MYCTYYLNSSIENAIVGDISDIVSFRSEPELQQGFYLDNKSGNITTSLKYYKNSYPIYYSIIGTYSNGTECVIPFTISLNSIF